MPADPPDSHAFGRLLPADLYGFALRYEKDRDRWRRSGPISKARARLERLAKAAAALQDSVGDLLPVDRRLASLPDDELGELSDAVARTAAAAARGVQKIEDEGGARGGARPAQALLSPHPRVALACALRDQLDEAPNRVLLEHLAQVLELAGEEPTGLEELLRRLPRRRERGERQNRRQPTPGSAIPQRDRPA